MPVPSILPPDMLRAAFPPMDLDMDTDSDAPQMHIPTDALAPPAQRIPPAAAMNLLNSLLVFYQQERSWVSRTRASLELALVQGPLVVAPAIGTPADSSASASASGSGSSSGSGSESEASSAASSNESTPATSDSESSTNGGNISEDRDGDMSLCAVKQEEPDDDSSTAPLTRRKQPRAPLTLRATAAAQAPDSRWLKRKQSFKLHLGPLASRRPARPRGVRAPADGPEPSAQLLELFGDLVDARMASCLRITRLVRDSNRALLYSW